MNKIFEVHITGDENINKELTKLGIKNIVVELLNPDLSLHRIEHMSSFVIKIKSFKKCLKLVNKLVKTLKSEVFRVKIESPYRKNYVERSLYIESHFRPFNNKLPLSRNWESGNVMATEREYNKSRYPYFRKKWFNHDIELCLYDTFVEQDKDWFDLYEEKTVKAELNLN